MKLNTESSSPSIYVVFVALCIPSPQARAASESCWALHRIATPTRRRGTKGVNCSTCMRASVYLIYFILREARPFKDSRENFCNHPENWGATNHPKPTCRAGPSAPLRSQTPRARTTVAAMSKCGTACRSPGGGVWLRSGESQFEKQGVSSLDGSDAKGQLTC